MRFLHRNPPTSKLAGILVDYDAKNASNPPYVMKRPLRRDSVTSPIIECFRLRREAL